MIDEGAAARFWSMVDVKGKKDCWLWLGKPDPSTGYAKMRVNGKSMYAHRISKILSGKIIRSRMVIDHKCRVRHCVNPAHLRIVTKAKNSTENSESVTAKNKIKTHCPEGHVYNQANTYVRHDGARSCRTCREFQRKKRYQETGR